MKHLLLISIPALLLVGGCANSNWNPDGYTWHDSTPLSNPARTYDWNDTLEGQSLERTESLESVLAGVSTDIANSLETKLSHTTPIYLFPQKGINNITSVLDHSLRGKLTQRGYTLSSTPVGAYALSYDIEPTQAEDAPPSTYDITLWDMAEEEPLLVEMRTQELPISAHAE